MASRKFDVAISFAGQDREYAEELALILKSFSVSVFYDKWEQAGLWGENLYDYLAEIYSKKARYCVMFLSEHYAEKLWTTYERRMAQARAFEEKESYILPIRLDDTEISGIPKTVAYLDLRTSDVSLADAAYLIVRKLGKEIGPKDVDPIAFTRSALKKVLLLDEDNLCQYHGRLDFEHWARHRDVLRNTIETIARFRQIVVPELTSALSKSRNRFLKRNILTILGMIGSNDATLAICKAVRDADDKVRNLAVLALQKLQDERAIPTLRATLLDKNTFVKRNAVVALATFSSPDLAETMIDVIKNEPDHFIQAHAVNGLASIGNAECLAYIKKLATHRNQYVREAAQQALRGRNKKPPKKKKGARRK